MYPKATEQRSYASPAPQSLHRTLLRRDSSLSVASTSGLNSPASTSSDDLHTKQEYEEDGPYLLYDMTDGEVHVWDPKPEAGSPDSGYASPAATYTADVDYDSGNTQPYVLDASVSYQMDTPSAPPPIHAPKPIRASAVALEAAYPGHEPTQAAVGPGYGDVESLPERVVGPAAVRLATVAESERAQAHVHVLPAENSADPVASSLP